MPLIRIDAVEGRTDSEVKALLDAVHRAVVKAFYIASRTRLTLWRASSREVISQRGD
jgi:Tautomerase enzyme